MKLSEKKHSYATCSGEARDLIKEAIIELDVQSTGKNRQRKYIYQSSTPCFNIHIFVEQFLRHLFFPFSKVLMRYKYKHQRPNRNQKSTVFVFELAPHLFWIILIIFAIFHKQLKYGGITTAEVVISLLAGVAWRLVVASKYASMTSGEYELFLNCEDDDEVSEMQTQMQLVTGWTHVDIPFCAHETSNALGRMGFYPESPHIVPRFCINRFDLSSWATLLGQDSSNLLSQGSQESQNIHVCVADLLALIIHSSQPKLPNKIAFWSMLVFVILFSVLPGLARVSCTSISALIVDDQVDHICLSESFFGDGVAVNLFSLLLTFHSFFPMFSMNLFFVSSFAGSFRQLYSSTTLTNLARIDTESLPLSSCPVLDLKNPNNIRAWVRARLALHYFGMRYVHRIDLYTKMCAVILVSLLSWVYVHSKSIDENGGQPNRLLVDVRYWTACYVLLVWGGAFAVVIAVMAATNFELIHQEIEFLLHRLTVRESQSVEKTLREEHKVSSNELNTSERSKSLVQYRNSSSEEEEEYEPEWFEVMFGSAGLKRKDSAKHQGSEQDEQIPTISSPSPVLTPATAITKSSNNHPNSVTVSKTQQMHMKQKSFKETMLSDYEMVVEEAKFEELDDLLDTVVLIAEAQSRIDPRRFLGIDTSWQFMLSYIVAWGSVIGLTLTVAGLDYQLGESD